jgi:hypothetical protein
MCGADSPDDDVWVNQALAWHAKAKKSQQEGHDIEWYTSDRLPVLR